MAMTDIEQCTFQASWQQLLRGHRTWDTTAMTQLNTCHHFSFLATKPRYGIIPDWTRK